MACELEVGVTLTLEENGTDISKYTIEDVFRVIAEYFIGERSVQSPHRTGDEAPLQLHSCCSHS